MATTKVTTDVIDMSGNAGGLTWVTGTTVQQPSGVIGEIREDTDTNRTLVYTNQVGTSPTTSTCDYPAGAGAQALYQFDTATLTTDTCGNYSAGTNNNVTQNTTVKKFGTSSAEFNGSTADIDLEAGLDSTTMSVSFWIYIDATITTNGVVVELENGYGVWFLATSPASGKLGVQNKNANLEATLSNAQLGTGAWHHVAAVWTGVGGSSNRTFYLDNVVQTGGTVSDYLTCDENTLGSRRSGEFFDGYLDQVRFYNTALTASQVDNLFNESSTSTGNEWRNLKETAVTLPSFDVDFLVVAGGGGGGNLGGGGGAGGLKNSWSTEPSGGGGPTLNSKSFTPGATAYTITVGSGGAGSTNQNNNGTNGVASQFDDITTTGGGGGSAHNNSVANTGGSGGGGASSGNTSNGAAGTTNEGNAGGNGQPQPGGYPGGGGGGAGAVGAPGTGTNQSGAGGVGLASTIITTAIATSQNVGEVVGTDVFFAGGGGGPGKSSGLTPGLGGNGGGGNGTAVNPSNGTPGAANTGGGGGGGGYDASVNAYRNGGNGGSGVVILRCTRASATFTVGVDVNGVTTTAGQIVNGTAVGSDYVFSITAAAAGSTITFS